MTRAARPLGAPRLLAPLLPLVAEAELAAAASVPVAVEPEPEAVAEPPMVGVADEAG